LTLRLVLCNSSEHAKALPATFSSSGSFRITYTKRGHWRTESVITTCVCCVPRRSGNDQPSSQTLGLEYACSCLAEVRFRQVVNWWPSGETIAWSQRSEPSTSTYTQVQSSSRNHVHVSEPFSARLAPDPAGSTHPPPRVCMWTIPLLVQYHFFFFLK
jgi:hypothetical protein